MTRMTLRYPSLRFTTFFLGALLFSIQAHAQTIHVVLAADTVSNDIASDMKVNLGNMEMSLASGIPKKHLNPKTIAGADFSKENVLSTIKDLKTDPNDAILFFYSGHGYYTSGVGTFFTPPADNGEKLHLSEITSSMRGHGCRLTVSLVDCCSLTPDGKRMFMCAAPAGSTSISPLFTELFINSTGEIAVNSSAPGEYALCGSVKSKNNECRGGSLFTNALFDNMSRNHSRQLSWEDLILKVKSDVAKEFSQMKKDGTKLTNGKALNFQESQTVWANRNGQNWIPFEPQ